MTLSATILGEEITRVFQRNPERELADLAERLRLADGGVVFGALYPWATRRQGLGPAAGAAWLLHRVNPRCPLSCLDATRELLADWDVSLEEVPRYLAAQFGAAHVRDAVATLRDMTRDAEAQARLRAIDYWVDGFAARATSEAEAGGPGVFLDDALRALTLPALGVYNDGVISHAPLSPIPAESPWPISRSK